MRERERDRKRERGKGYWHRLRHCASRYRLVKIGVLETDSQRDEQRQTVK